MTTFRRCPAYVPLQAVEGVRALLTDFQRAGCPSFVGFTRCWAASDLPALLAGALQAGSSRRARGPEQTTDEGQAAHEPSAAKLKEVRAVCLRHLYAAATSFFPGLWDGGAEGEGAERAAEASDRDKTLVQTGVLFTLFCLYFGQPSEHAKEPVPMTPAGWQHLLHLCEKARIHGAHGAATDMADVRAAYARLHGAAALSFCCAPAPLEAESFRRPDVRSTGVWGDAYHADRDVPAQRDAEQTWLKFIREAQGLVQELDAGAVSGTLSEPELSELSGALQAYTGASRGPVCAMPVATRLLPQHAAAATARRCCAGHGGTSLTHTHCCSGQDATAGGGRLAADPRVHRRRPSKRPAHHAPSAAPPSRQSPAQRRPPIILKEESTPEQVCRKARGRGVRRTPKGDRRE